MKNPFTKIKNWIKELPNRKHYIDFIAAFLTIPVLLTVLISNISNIRQKTGTSANQTNQKNNPIIITSPPVSPGYNVSQAPSSPPASSKSATVSPAACQKGIGHIRIAYPSEGQLVSDNPVCVVINYERGNYCSVVWSYSINNGSWSDFSNDNPCLYNMSSGNIKFNLKVKSLTSSSSITLERNFIYQNSSATPAPTPTPSPSPTQSPSKASSITPTASPAPSPNTL